MYSMIKSLLIISLVFLVFDYIWIYVINKEMWIDQIKLIQGPDKTIEFRMSGAIVAYLILIFATFYLVTYQIKNNMNIDSTKDLVIQSTIMGSVLGLGMYGIFDATNYVMFKDYKLSVAIQDALYGVFVTAVASICGTLVY